MTLVKPLFLLALALPDLIERSIATVSVAFVLCRETALKLLSRKALVVVLMIFILLIGFDYVKILQFPALSLFSVGRAI
ncbi:hypothetical protein [Sinobacterium norvegicum]|uniref:hypothetical protein n=1 Tax=Sinobacterium norvegicum TaxID=1641715 RepID=UPI001F41B06D|nr:hypothetical protein [Sinobacterium norvegicum]